MIPLILAIAFNLTAAEDLAPRLDTLRFHVERLHAISVPESARADKEAKLTALEKRLADGATNVKDFNALYLAIDDVRTWLLANSAHKPETAPGDFEESEDKWAVKTPRLTLTMDRESLAMSVKTPGHEWHFGPSDDKDMRCGGKAFRFADAKSRVAQAFNTGYSEGMVVTLKDFPERPALEVMLGANTISNEIVFEIMVRNEDGEMGVVRWPKAIALGNSEKDQTVIPRMQGMLLPGNWPQEFHASDLCNSRSFYMPWWGQIHDGHGVQTILETRDDAGGYYDHPSGGPTDIGPRWYPTLGRFGYQRMIRYVFSENASYVTMAKRYRKHVRDTGRFVTLAEKRVRTPALDEVIGKPVIHLGALYHFVQNASLFNKDTIERNHALITFDQLAEGLRRVHSNGIDDAYVHLDGWGFYGYDNGHPDVLPVGEEQGGWEGLRRFATTCEELGYLFAVHDQYRDFYLNAVSFDDRLAATRLDGGREEHSTWCGGPQTILSPRFSPGYVRRNHDLFAAHGIKVRGAYLDVFAVVPLEESAQPTHPVTRSECALYRRNCFDVLRARGYVVSSEEPADYLVPSLDLVHHGPYPTYPNLGGGDASGIPVPLFSLVYHDSILLPWEMGEDGGWGIPKGDAGWLHCLLNAGLPYVGTGAKGAQIDRVKEAAALAQHCGLLEMTNHEILDASRRKQRTTYSDGTQVTVDFATKEYTIKLGG